MRKILLRGVVLGAAMCLACGAAIGLEEPQKPSDTEIANLLIGKWRSEQDDVGLTINGTEQYGRDGTFQFQLTITTSVKQSTTEVSGTWKVSGGVVILAFTKTNTPGVIREGEAAKNQVIAIDAEMLKYKNEFGKETVRKRVKE